MKKSRLMANTVVALLMCFLGGFLVIRCASTPEPLVIAKIDTNDEAKEWKVLEGGRIKKGSWNIAEFSNLFIEAQGDGQEYTFFMADQNAKNKKYRFEAQFMIPEGENSTVKLKLSDFKAARKGKKVTDAEPLTLDSVVEMGIQVKNIRKSKYNLAVKSFWMEK